MLNYSLLVSWGRVVYYASSTVQNQDSLHGEIDTQNRNLTKKRKKKEKKDQGHIKRLWVVTS